MDDGNAMFQPFSMLWPIYSGLCHIVDVAADSWALSIGASQVPVTRGGAAKLELIVGDNIAGTTGNLDAQDIGAALE